MVEPIEMPFNWGLTCVGTKNHVLEGGPDRPMGRDTFEGDIYLQTMRPFAKLLWTLVIVVADINVDEAVDSWRRRLPYYV